MDPLGVISNSSSAQQLPPATTIMTWDLQQPYQLGLITMDHLGTLVSTIAFIFKIIAILWVAPWVGLIAFDICLYMWRIVRPQSAPADIPSTPRAAINNVAIPLAEQKLNINLAPRRKSSLKDVSSTAVASSSNATQRRVRFSDEADSTRT